MMTRQSLFFYFGVQMDPPSLPISSPVNHCPCRYHTVRLSDSEGAHLLSLPDWVLAKKEKRSLSALYITSKNNYCVVKKIREKYDSQTVWGQIFCCCIQEFSPSLWQFLVRSTSRKFRSKKEKKRIRQGEERPQTFRNFISPPENCSRQFLFPFDPTQRNSCVDPDLPRTRKERRKGKKTIFQELIFFSRLTPFGHAIFKK